MADWSHWWLGPCIHASWLVPLQFLLSRGGVYFPALGLGTCFDQQCVVEVRCANSQSESQKNNPAPPRLSPCLCPENKPLTKDGSTWREGPVGPALPVKATLRNVLGQPLDSGAIIHGCCFKPSRFGTACYAAIAD